MSVRRMVGRPGRSSTMPADGRDGVACRGSTALLRTAVRCNNARLEREAARWASDSGDPTESALLVAAAAARLRRRRRAARARRGAASACSASTPRLKRMTTLDRGAGRRAVSTTPRARRWSCWRAARRSATPTGDRPDERRRPGRGARAFERYAGQRAARARLRATPGRAQVEDGERDAGRSRDLHLPGAGGARRSAAARGGRRGRALSSDAGIRIIVVTGDHGLTADRDRPGGRDRRQASRPVITGAELDALPERRPATRCCATASELIVARSNPETKLHIVDALRAQGTRWR